LQSGGGGVATAINKRYHTVDRNQRLSREQKSSTMQQQQKTNQQRTSTTSTSVNGYSQYPPGKPSGKENNGHHHPTQHQLSDNSDRSYRSRSMSRSSGDRLYRRNGGGEGQEQHPSPPKMRDDLDSERASRLKRAMSFTSSTKSAPNNRINKSFLGSVKSLYATIAKRATSPTRKTSTNGSGRRSRVSNEWFDGNGHSGSARSGSAPSAPPRKHRSSLNLNGSSVYSDNSGGRSAWTTPAGSIKRSSRVSAPPPSKSTSQPPQRSSYRHSTANLAKRSDVDEVDSSGYSGSGRPRKTSKIERRKTISSYDDMMENRKVSIRLKEKFLTKAPI
jgi:hypothetical protein